MQPGAAAPRAPARSTLDATAPGQLRVIKRNGTVLPYDESKIGVAITKAFLAVEGGTAAASSRIRETGAPDSRQQVTHDLRAAHAVRRHHPHRGDPGPGGTGPDARRRAQGRPRLRPLPRGARPGPGRGTRR
ncbi:MAG: ATP cone domain-containing protein [Gammaproteobacteria bacterium]|nr:ATP cone domain-containing protein [Gammaproteobacteria bacterium]